ncbi:hypothetical protein [Limimaricola hongkongensis]|uniref:NADH-ubiquinone oxidoreductase chain E n=1 Tax=Limimaricola hongkongensis DSM 17492 TaxID=1122180 RepID=A0A017H9U8_9RHOB|nr:hypothetical protein [Limimaricola hongkongensis]EYD71292.1 NADH-ubiquinone oxidoreductase chain E [Limimaricola hongkongensis DSM 17492]
MNGIGSCRTITIGAAALGGVLLWILLALGARGWFSSLLIAALLAAAAAALVLALVCPGEETQDAETAPAKDDVPARPQDLERHDTVAPLPTDATGTAADTGGRQAESVRPASRVEETGASRVNDVSVLDDAGADDLGDEVSRVQAQDAEAATPPAPEMPDGVAAEMRQEPELLDAPRGQADDLKRLRGVGPKLEEQLNRLGVWHLRQIAAWSEGEAAWIDDHLEGFRGRIQRDDWIGQAREMTKDDA